MAAYAVIAPDGTAFYADERGGDPKADALGLLSAYHARLNMLPAEKRVPVGEWRTNCVCGAPATTTASDEGSKYVCERGHVYGDKLPPLCAWCFASTYRDHNAKVWKCEAHGVQPALAAVAFAAAANPNSIVRIV